MAELPLVRLGDLALGLYLVATLVAIPVLALLTLLKARRRQQQVERWLPAPDPITGFHPQRARALRAEAQLERVAAERDEVLAKLDEVAQRLRRCTCAVGRELAAELEQTHG